MRILEKRGDVRTGGEDRKEEKSRGDERRVKKSRGEERGGAEVKKGKEIKGKARIREEIREG